MTQNKILSPRKQTIHKLLNRLAPEREKRIKNNIFFYDDNLSYLRFLIPEGLRILDLGCGTGYFLNRLYPSYGVGVDFCGNMIAIAQQQYPELDFIVGDVEDPSVMEKISGKFDIILLSDTICYLDDCQAFLDSLHKLCTRETRLVLSYYSPLWEPILKIAEWFDLKMEQPSLNWLSNHDTNGLLNLADFDVVKQERRFLCPKRLLGIGFIVNRFIASLPVIKQLTLQHYTVARPMRSAPLGKLSSTVVIPCRNEKGNVEAAVKRLPKFCKDQEILFIEGGSQDGTLEEIQRVITEYPNHNINVLQQDGKGKGDALRKSFTHAKGEVLIILDGDLTVPPEFIPRFYDALISGKGNFINGTRLIYPQEKAAMRFLNMIANHSFAKIFSWLLNQSISDTLCGTKVLTKSHYEMIAKNRSYFGDFDPFGDFDLIFGASKLNLKIIDLPIRYAKRSYGETQISRFRHGLLLLRMTQFAYRKLKVL